MSRFSLARKVAVVTGGSRGIGREIVLAFAAAGADVVIASRKIAPCEELAVEVESTTGRSALAVACHVADWTQCDALVEASYARFGKVDVLVNNAGMSPLYGKLSEVSRELYDKVLDVNLGGPFRLSAVIGERMMDGDGGSIINVSSIASVRPNQTVIPYAAAKAGLNSMTIGLAQAFGPKVRVNCIQSGPVLTDISKAWSDDMIRQGPKGYALKKFGQADELVGAALYFASDASSFTTGAILPVDGGAP